jgi:hypothetical protein
MVSDFEDVGRPFTARSSMAAIYSVRRIIAWALFEPSSGEVGAAPI